MTSPTQRGANAFGAAFIAPALILYAGFVMLPIGMSCYYSMTNWRIMGTRRFVGLANFVAIFNDPAYLQSACNTLVLIAASLFIQLPLALIVAYVLYCRTRGTDVLRTIYFIPVVISPIAIGTMFSLFYNGELGPLNAMLDGLGLGALRRNWLSDPHMVLGAVIFPDVWRYVGYYVVLFLSGLVGIPKDVLESAMIDGASRTKSFFAIILPLLKDVIGVAVILSVTGCLKAFEMPLAITDGGPGNKSMYLSLYMFKTAFAYQKFGYGSAVTMTILAYALAFTVVFRKLFGKGGAE